MKFLYLLPLLLFVTLPAFAHIGFQPVYQPTTVAGSNPATLYCTFGDFLNSYNSTTNSFTCDTGGGGENNTASNLSPGTGLFFQKSGVDLEFKSLTNGSNITLTANDTTIMISASGSAGEANTMSSPTHANSLVLTKSGVDLPIKGIACGGSITCSNNSTDVTLSFTETPGSGFTTISSAPQTTATILSDNSTIANKAVIKTLTQGTGITLTNGSNAVTFATSFESNSITCSGTDKISSYDNSTGLYTCTADTSGSGPTSLAANVTASNTAAYSNLWKITLTANSGNTISGVIVAQSNTAGVAVQAGANLTSVAQAQGWCLWETPTAATTNTLDFVVLATATTDTGETVWLPAINTPQPILFTCTISTGASPPDIWINIQPEAAGTVSAKAGSYYIKTP